MKLAYVCTNYNNSHFTEAAVQSLVNSAGDEVELKIVVVDNASRAESIAPLRKLAESHSCVDLILNSENAGYFRGLNDGIHHVRQHFPAFEHLVVGNNDLEFPIDFCRSVKARLDLLDRYPVISPDVVTLDGEHQNPHVIHSISKTRELGYDLYYANYVLALVLRWVASVTRGVSARGDEKQHRTAQSIYQGHGSCYLLGPVFFKHFTELWAPTFLMGEEYFLSKQLSDHGFSTFYEPSIAVTHHCHGSLQSLPSRRQWEFARDAHKVYRKYVKVL